jgi:hypothetical protein
MGNRVSFSPDILRIGQVAEKHTDIERSLIYYYHEPGLPLRDPKFVGYSNEEVQTEFRERRLELDRDSSLGILAALEANFCVDYLVRCYNKQKDRLSREFRDLYKAKGHQARLEEDILGLWKKCVPTAKPLISKIIGAFRYRHWLAHGRYWVPKLGRTYEFLSVYLLAQEMDVVFEEQRNVQS